MSWGILVLVLGAIVYAKVIRGDRTPARRGRRRPDPWLDWQRDGFPPPPDDEEERRHQYELWRSEQADEDHWCDDPRDWR